MASLPALLLLLLFFVLGAAEPRVCIVGSGIGGSSVAHFLKQYTCGSESSVSCVDDIRIFEKRRKAGGRMATVTIGGEEFEAGASIIHPKNLHARRFLDLLGLTKTKSDDSDTWLGIWDGSRFVFKTLPPPPTSSSAFYRKIHELLSAFLLFNRYGFSLFRMQSFVNQMVDRFMLFYTEVESRPVFETVEEMLKWSDLYGLTRRTLEEELTDARLSPRLMDELVTVITRINYGQSLSISGLAGAVSLAGSDSGLWSVDGGNWQLAAGLIDHCNATLHLNEEISSISYAGGYYVLNSTKENSYNCEVTVIATPLDELSITFVPSVSVPNRSLQHTFTTFVRGLLNPEYFGLSSTSEIPVLVGTIEDPNIPFSCISVLKKHSEEEMTYKMFSRAPLEESLLDQVFSTRTETLRINWPAYPHYEAPEVFAPILLDGAHLYYINSFESAASTIETSAVAAENVARLIISRLSGSSSNTQTIMSTVSSHKSPNYDL